ncbi:MAG: efflux RND transporter periplasmic adaptor subunit [Edaphocola sp.]
MNKRNKIILALVSVIGVVLLSLYFFRDKERVISWETTMPTNGDIAEKVTATGTIQILDTVAVGTQVSGIVKSIHVDYNSVVKKGQLLAEIDPTLLRAQADQISGNVAAAQSALKYQEGNFDRQKQLYATGAISKADYDNALNTYNSAKASLASAQAQLRSANQNLSYTKIYSPLDGVVLSRSVSEGQTVASSFSTPTLFTLAKDITKMVVYAGVDEADISQVSANMKATFTVDAYLNHIFNGRVSDVRLQPSVSSNVVTYPTLIEVDNSEKKLKPGMTATITIYSKEANNVLLIPVAALKFSPESIAGKELRIKPLPPAEQKNNASSVWVKNGNSLEQKAIATGLNDNTHVEILSGISAKDTVVTAATVAAGTSASQSSGSPFMPKPPSRSKSSKK